VGPLISLAVLGLISGLSPTTLIVFIALLATLRGRPNAIAFLVGWTVSLFVVFFVSYKLGGTPTLKKGNGRVGVQILEILIGAALVWFGANKWRSLPKREPAPPSESKLLKRLDKMTPWQATLLGIVEQPWTITAAAAVVVVHHQLKTPAAVGALLLFLLLSTATVGVIFIYFIRRPDSAQERLHHLRERLTAAGPQIFAGAAVLIGLALVADGAVTLANM